MSDIDFHMPHANVAVSGHTPQLDTAQLIKPEKKQRISKRLADAIELLATGECKTQKIAAERVGLNVQYLCQALAKPHVRVFIEQRARQTIAAGAMRASARLIQLVDATSEHVSADVSKHVLACAGIKPSSDAQVSVNVDIKAGFVIDLTEVR